MNLIPCFVHRKVDPGTLFILACLAIVNGGCSDLKSSLDSSKSSKFELEDSNDAHMQDSQQADSSIRSGLESQSEETSPRSNRYKAATNWIQSELVQAHFPLSKGWIDKPEFLTVADLLSRINAPSMVTRHVKGGEEGPWWNTSVGTRYCSPKDRKCEREPAKEILVAHAQKQKVIAYYRDVWDQPIETQFPEWVCYDENGLPQSFKDGQVFLSLVSPYKNIVKQRIVELTRMGYEGFYFDFKHQPEKGCWERFSREEFKRETGLDLPGPGQINLANATFQEFMKFNNRKVATAFREWRTAAKAVNPNVQFLVSLSYFPSLTTPHLPTDILEEGDLAKSEFRLPAVIGPMNGGPFYRMPAGARVFADSIRMQFGYSLLRSGADNNPAHIWLNLIEGAQNPSELRRGMAAVLGLGGIANLMMPTTIFSDPAIEDTYRAGFATSTKWGEYFKG